MAQLVVGGGAEALQWLAEDLADHLVGHLRRLLGSRSAGEDTVVRCVGAVMVLPAEDGRRRRPPAGWP
jgi:DNA-directed RNA polymerase specialized sigma24 family protein